MPMAPSYLPGVKRKRRQKSEKAPPPRALFLQIAQMSNFSLTAEPRGASINPNKKTRVTG